jgi:nucleoside-diphosphate-sugar epimerase
MTHVCVTGGSGFIALHLIIQLLEKGYTVNTTVRSLSNKSKISFLLNLQEKFPKKLNLYEADLLTPNSFDESIKEVSIVHHVASPFLPASKVEDPMKQLIEPALKGTENVLNSVLKFGVKKVILTSSIAAICSPMTVKDGSTIDESFWNETSTMEESGGPYRISKLKAEQYATEFCQKNIISLVSINPVLVTGEMLHGDFSLNTSSDMIRQVVDGTLQSTTSACFGFVDVKDVAKAHILASENESCVGNRYIISECQMKYCELPNVLRKLYPNLPITEKVSEQKFPEYKIDNSKSIEELGLIYTPLEDYLKETVETLLKFGYLKK